MDKIILIKILYTAASIQGLFLGILLWRTKNNQPADKILSVLLFLISFHLVLVGFDERAFFMAFPHLSRISWVIGTLYGPLVFLFIRQITGIEVKPYWIALLFLPFLVVFFSLVPYFIQSAEVKRDYLDAFEIARQDDFGWINKFVSVVHVVFVSGNLVFYSVWERKQRDEFSAPEAIRVKWLSDFLVFMAAITVFGVLIFFARLWDIEILSDIYRFHFIGVVFLFYWLSYKALTQPFLFGIVHQAPEAPSPAVRKRVEPEGQDASVFKRVKSVLENERLYLKADLTLTELAGRAGFSRNQVSHAINRGFNGNFFDFINEFRIEEYKRQAVDPAKRHLTQLGIAQESGFSSKASFYSVFKKKTGMTPAEFLERQSGPAR